jgi:beta-galactosidase/beta-glucuronidase
MKTTPQQLAVILLLGWAPMFAAEKSWQPAQGPLLTRWAKDVSPKNAHPEYPRPQMVRKDWQNLNGLWDYAITAKDAPQPVQWDGQILVPFPVESALSGVMRRVYETNRLWYRRTFTVPRGWKGKNVLLNFGAVDWETTVWVNGKQLGSHRGGYDGFSFDITETLKPKGEQEIVVAVWDPTDAGFQPRGKQVRNTHGIWYTPTSGIWQTVWLEPVDAVHVESLKIFPDVDAGKVTVSLKFAKVEKYVVARFRIFDGDQEITFDGRVAGVETNIVTGQFSIPHGRLWSPESPFLYRLEISMLCCGKSNDEFESYFALRKISVAKDATGFNRLCLNNQPLFQFGPLDQGFWPDGIYTAPTDEALRYDIEMTKALGMNMARKHVKIEPDRWYYWCDKLGLLVWQDMPNGDRPVPSDRKSVV